MSRHTYPYKLGWKSVKYVAPNLTNTQAKRVAAALGPALHTYVTHGAPSKSLAKRRAVFCVAQFAHESDHFRTTTEYASGSEYEGRRDLGNTHPGDGRRFKGRGFIQITGRSNYAELSHALGHDFITHPEDLARPEWAAKASAWWWREHGCNVFADHNDFVGLTRRINGGTNGLDSRQAFRRRARHVGRWLVPARRR